MSSEYVEKINKSILIKTLRHHKIVRITWSTMYKWHTRALQFFFIYKCIKKHYIEVHHMIHLFWS